MGLASWCQLNRRMMQVALVAGVSGSEGHHR
jgi:hypothetical protein